MDFEAMRFRTSRRCFLGGAAAALAATSFSSAGRLFAQAAPPALSAAEFIHGEIAAGSFPGAGLIVWQGGRETLAYFEGTYCDGVARDKAMHRDVTHMLYSFSKGVSATVVMIAHQRKLVDFDVPVGAYIPGYKGGWKDETTLRHLLTHSAGIPNVDLKAVYTDDQWDEAVEACCAAQVEWEPGSRTEYHARSGLFLAAEAVRSRIAGRPSWEAICREWLLDPIGASTFSFKIPEGGGVALTPQPKDLPHPLGVPTFSMAGHPAGGGFGRLDDILKVLQLHLDGGRWEGRVIVEPDSLAEMHRVQYREAILKAEAEGRKPDHEPFALGWKLRFTTKNDSFGLGTITPADTFGHAGIWTVMGNGFPGKRAAMAFVSTAPPPLPDLARIRNGITDRVYAALG